ncbi:MAG: hypothetical protein C5B52_15390 [Bacteroidetes bacterium]|nr:MAG: hypothetical protein C5B52_15390 [Bacteroidota bacterium]
MVRKIILGYLVFSIFSLKAICQEDSVYLYNGQILIGEVQRVNLGELTIDDLDMKMTSVKLYKIKILKIFHSFKIETIDRKLLYGRMQTLDKQGWVDIFPDTGRAVFSIPITNLFYMVSLEKNFFKRLTGNLSAGLSFTKSSNIGQVNLSASVMFATKSWAYQLSFSELGSIDSGRYTRDNESAQFFTSYDLSATWFLAGYLQYQRNLELSISRRYSEMFGGGNKLFIRKDWQLLGISGVSFSQEKSTEGIYSGLLVEVPFMLRFNYYHPRHPDLQISTSQTAYFSLSEAGRVRVDGSTNFSWQIIRYFYLTLTPYTNFDSKPPSLSASKFDYGIVFGITYKF